MSVRERTRDGLILGFVLILSIVTALLWWPGWREMAYFVMVLCGVAVVGQALLAMQWHRMTVRQSLTKAGFGLLLTAYGLVELSFAETDNVRFVLIVLMLLAVTAHGRSLGAGRRQRA
jgi:hypothetical protein